MLSTLAGLGLLLVAQASAQKCKGTSGAAYASCCDAAWQSWATAKAAYEVPTTTYASWYREWTTSLDTNVPITTLCDGFPRAMKPYKTLFEGYVTITPTPVSYQDVEITPTYTKPAPTCRVNEDDCIPYASAWSSSYSAWATDNNNPYPTKTLHCAAYLACPTAVNAPVCKLYPTDATVYYWPTPTVTTGDFCATPRQVLSTRPPNKSRSTVIAGTTFVSPTAYVRIGTVNAKRHTGQYTATACGRQRTNVFLTFPGGATEISTRKWKPGTATNTRSLDPLDFNTPFPASAYFIRGTPTSCTTTTGCETILPTIQPYLDTPLKLTAKDPEWKYCTPRSEGLSDATFIPLAPNPPQWPKPTKAPRAVRISEDELAFEYV